VRQRQVTSDGDAPSRTAPGDLDARHTAASPAGVSPPMLALGRDLD